MRIWINGVVLACICAPTLLWGADGGVVRMTGMPFEPAGNTDINQYINALYWFSISIAAVLAVLRLIFAGAQYVLSDIVTNKERAKKDIYTSIIGLLVVLTAVLILQIINPQLTQLNALNLDGVNQTAPRERSSELDCSAGPNSDPRCCAAAGGSYSNTSSGGVCDIGETVDTGIEDSGATTEEEREAYCRQQNLSYNPSTGECLTTGNNIIPFRSSDITESQRRLYCSGMSAEYVPDVGCRMRE